MSWEEKDLMSLRKEFVIQAIKKEVSMAELCRRYNISRKTGYKWLNRYLIDNDNLQDQSKAPHFSPNISPNSIVKKIIEVRETHPAWGARKIKTILENKNNKNVPSKSTIHRILKGEGHVKSNQKNIAYLNRFEREAPNSLWQMDFKGHFPYAKGRCHPLTILDDHSRFSIALYACTNQTGEAIKPLLISAFRCYGLPEQINVDNGNPWGSVFDHSPYTTFSVWLIRNGIKITHSRPHHPQTNGKIERFHRTLNAEVLVSQYFRSIAHIQKIFDEWRGTYNLERPHEGINMQVPAKRYKPSYRSYSESLSKIYYSDDYTVRKVDGRGRISFDGRQIFIGTPFANENIGIRNISPKIQVYYSHQKLGEIDLTKLRKKTITNLYSKRVAELS